MTRKLLQIILLWMTLLSAASAEYLPYDITLTAPVISKDPDHFHGYRAAIGYQPASLIWEKVQVYFDLSYGHWWVSGNTPNQSINIYSLAPIVRFYMIKNTTSFFLQASIGPSYLSRTRIGPRNLGMHFSFQDEIGMGLAFGANQQVAVNIGALHYSNGSLCEHNSGITVPLILSVNYRF